LQQKREIFDTIFSESGPKAELGMSRKEIFGLFRLHTRDGGDVPIVPDAA
jgi:hypothetical protein